MAEIKLMPCPFCGGNAGMVAIDRTYWAYCTVCHAETDMVGDAEHAARLWNKRTEKPFHSAVSMMQDGLALHESQNITLRGLVADLAHDYFMRGYRFVG